MVDFLSVRYTPTMAKLTSSSCEKRDAIIRDSIEALIDIGVSPLITWDLLQMAELLRQINSDKSVGFKVVGPQVTRVLLAMHFERLGVFKVATKRGAGSLLFSQVKFKFVSETSHGFGDEWVIRRWLLERRAI